MSIYGRNGYVEDEYNGGQGVPSVQQLVDAAIVGVQPVPSTPVVFSPTAAGTVVALPLSLSSANNVQLRVNGVEQWQGKDYTVNNGVVTFTGAGVTPQDVIDARVVVITPVT